VRAGLLARTPRGRVAPPAAWAHLGLRPPRTLAAARPLGRVDAAEPDLFDAAE
jgi:Holliday junction DNA helicase RuvB